MALNNYAHIVAKRSLLLAEIREIFVVLVVASILPVFVHLIPSQSVIPIGARLLPIFYAPFVAIVLYRPRVGIIAGLLAPLANAVITGKPDIYMVSILTAELVIFTAASSLLYARYKSVWGIAPAAYLIAKFFSNFIFGTMPGFTILTPLPGLVMLMLINWLAMKYKEKRNE